MIGRIVRFKQVAALGSVIFIVWFLSGCAETESKYDEVWDSSLSSCGPNCHSPDGIAADGPDMSTQDKFYANVVGKTVNNDYPDWADSRSGDCDDLQMIKVGDAANSSLVAGLVESVSSAQTCETAFSFHVGENVTSATEAFSDLVSWINDGAEK